MEQKIIVGDCVEVMHQMPNESVDMVLTSPPYDSLRDYKGYSFEFEQTANEIYRLLKPGGVCVWIVGDQTVNGSETGTSFRQALFFKEIGLNLHDTMIWHKPNAMPNVDKTRYCQSFEYMFILTKGRPKGGKLREIPTKNAGKVITRTTLQTQNCNKSRRINRTKDTRIDFNLYVLNIGGRKEAQHPAIFPEQLARDHIVSWSNEGDTVLDPFLGSGTTLVACTELGRKGIGIEISEEYAEIARERLAQRHARLNI